jgi:uncharacterized protein
MAFREAQRFRPFEEGDLENARKRLESDPAVLHARDNAWWGMTPLIWASRGGHAAMVIHLLERGSHPNDRDCMGRSALYHAAFFGATEVVKALLEANADPTVADGFGTTPLMMAASGGHHQVVRRLLSHPAALATINHVGARGQTALWMASRMGHVGIAKSLIRRGADPTIADDDGVTPMAIAEANGRLRLCQLLEVSQALAHGGMPMTIRCCIQTQGR